MVPAGDTLERERKRLSFPAGDTSTATKSCTEEML